MPVEENRDAEILAEGFQFLYDRPPSPDELDRLVVLGILKTSQLADIMRRIIYASDRQVLSTPFLIRFGRDDIAWNRIDGELELALDTADIAVSRYISQGVYEPHLTSFFRKTIRPGMCVADVGANIGYYSVLSSNLVGPTGRVFSFEPNSENSRLILISVEKNDVGNLKLYPVALSDHTGHAFFSSALGSNGGLLSITIDVLMSPQCIVVPTVRMDDIIDSRIDFIKIDVEGAEGLVLSGARDLIARCQPIITMEFSPEMLRRVSGVNPLELLRHIKSLGYSINLIEKNGCSGDIFPINDIESFIGCYGSDVRIEDLAFLPSG